MRRNELRRSATGADITRADACMQAKFSIHDERSRAVAEWNAGADLRARMKEAATKAVRCAMNQFDAFPREVA